MQLTLDDLWSPRAPNLPSPDPITLAQAQADFRDHLDDGTACPCCGKHGQRYRRSLNSTMARELIWLVRTAGADRRWVSVPDEAPGWVQRGRQLPTTGFWHLVERQAADPEDSTKRTSGIWRPTKLGAEFVLGNATVPKHVHEYRGKPERWSGPHIGIRDALGHRFDYYELMGWQPPVPTAARPEAP